MELLFFTRPTPLGVLNLTSNWSAQIYGRIRLFFRRSFFEVPEYHTLSPLSFFMKGVLLLFPQVAGEWSLDDALWAGKWREEWEG